jgi:outer membrane protein assembly factor BamB
VLFGADYVTSHRPDTGAEIWRSGSLNARKIPVWRTIVSPVATPGGVVACLPRTFNPVVAISPGRAGDKAAAPIAWRNTQASSDVPTPLYYQGRLYVLNGNKQTMLCLDPKTGVTKWSGRFKTNEIFSASPTGSDGKIYCIGEEGTVVVLLAGEKFKVLSEFNPEAEGANSELAINAKPSGPTESGPILSTIVAANGHLFVRTPQYLYCVGAKP